jgi:transposase-like protein
MISLTLVLKFSRDVAIVESFCGANPLLVIGKIHPHVKTSATKGQVITCLCCNGEAKKFGKFRNANRIVQRYRCVRCAKTFSESQPLDGLRVDFDKACQVVNLLCESVGIRAIQRLTGLHQETILGILETAGQKATTFLDSKVRNVNAELIQADEIHTTVYSKQINTPEDETERGEQYMFLSVDRRSNPIICRRSSRQCLARLIRLRSTLHPPPGSVSFAFRISRTRGFSSQLT